MRRALRVHTNYGHEFDLEISKAAKIKGDAKMIHLDKLNDGTWRLIFSSDVIDDFSHITSFEVIRDDY